MTAHIIHNPSRTDRLKLLENELVTQGIEDYIFFPAVKGKNPMEGISKAHKNVVRYAKENKMPEILIFEDDVKFTAEGAFDFFLKNKPEQFDLYLSGIYFGIIKTDGTVNNFASLHCYIIREQFYDKFLSVSENENIDRAVKNKGKFVVCYPFAAIQHMTYSDNKNKVVNYANFLKGRRLYGS